MIDPIKNRIDAIDWESIGNSMNEKGYALVPSFLLQKECEELISNYSDPAYYRKTIAMERYRFGAGEYKYFKHPLPGLIQSIREAVYPRLVPIANGWMNALGLEQKFPVELYELHEACRKVNQVMPTVLILKYGVGGFNTLHQDLYGEVYFPMQAILFLNEPGSDYTGGEFVLTQQIPRAQSKAIVLQPKRGDMLLITTNFRPIKGSRGYYRANMKHGVSEVHTGSRHTLGIIFHDAIS